MGFIEELTWRGMIHDVIPGTEEKLKTTKVAGYIGFDPSADSLHIGSLLQLIILAHFQRAGHHPIALIGGATGMIGDPSGKSAERNLLPVEQIEHNIHGLRRQLEKFLDFDKRGNPAQIVNNYDWYKEMNMMDFLRDVGKHITVSYMNAKDSVKNRLESGISFTEYSYQLLQGFDFYWLHQHKDCRIQMGGSDQWGNITTGVELIRRKAGQEAYAITSPLITKPDGSKFGKTEEGNVWLDPEKTSPYKFYQFWMNCTDEESANYLKVFTFMDQETIEDLVGRHRQAPHERILQKALAEDITVRVHSREAYETVLKATAILFGKAIKEQLSSLTETEFLEIFKGVPQMDLSLDQLKKGINLVDFLSEQTGILSSKSEARRSLKEGGMKINKEKVTDPEANVGTVDLLNDKYILVQKGKKHFFVVKVV